MQKIKKILASRSGDVLKKVHFRAKIDLLTPPTGGEEFFPKNPKSSLFYVYGVLTLCKKSEKSGAQILRYRRY